jgi:predicted lysophospholipase L1 biosynthesis ABC-type transport system permease subunit
MPRRDFEAYRKHQQGFEDLAAFTALGLTLSGHGGPAEGHLGAALTANFFDLLRTPPALGRTFARGDDLPGSEARVILAHSLWQAAAANLRRMARQLADVYPETHKPTDRVHVDHFASAYAGVGARTILLTMQAMTALVLVLGCANVTNLLLARGSGRWRELGARAALGARRGQLVNQLLLETMVLAGTGAVAGLVLAAVGVSLLNDQVIRHLEVPFFIRFELNPLVLAVTVGATLVAGIAAGVIPALRGE